MAALVDFVRRLLEDGSIVLSARPQAAADERQKAADVLARFYDEYCLDVAGPPVPFDAAAALGAAGWLWLACWFLLQHDDPPEVVEQALTPQGPPRTAAEHLSADLVLRFLPQVHRRARGVDAADVLTRRLEHLLRLYPLTGVLAEVEEGPLGPPDLGGHPGLMLLYAERLAEHPRPAWVPSGGPLREYVELVFAEQGVRLPAAPEPLGQTTETT